MHKKFILFLTLVVIIMFFSGCTTQNNSNNFNLFNNDDQSPIGDEWDLSAVVQLSDFTNNLDHKYSSISGNGQKIIYIQDSTETYPLGTTDFTVSPLTLWITDTAGSKIQTQIFDGWDEDDFYAFYGSMGGAPVLNYDATYAHIGVLKYINTGGYWLPNTNPTYMARIRLSDNSFYPIDLITYSGYDQTWLGCFRVMTNKIYCLVWFENLNDIERDVIRQGAGFLRMELDGSNQEFIYTQTDKTADDYPIVGASIFVDESLNRIYYLSYNSGNYHYLDISTGLTTELTNEDLNNNWVKGFSGYNLILDGAGGYIHVYNMGLDEFTTVGEGKIGSPVQNSVAANKIFYDRGGGNFCIVDFDGNKKHIIDSHTNVNEEYAGLYEWDTQYMPTNGNPVSYDSKKILVKEFSEDNDNPNYYLLKLGT
ncbi:MAG: hypothetical protein KAW45_04420 [Thermoplasmatales archaeon]|nr:hypothetical protein [Thermoplasmatales archaeon]